jgi:hypothetical protein
VEVSLWPPNQSRSKAASTASSSTKLALDTLFAQSGRTLRIFDRALSSGYNSPHRHDLLRKFCCRTARRAF